MVRQEIEHHVVIEDAAIRFTVERLEDAQQIGHHNLDAALLAHFAADGLFHRFAQLDQPARQ